MSESTILLTINITKSKFLALEGVLNRHKVNWVHPSMRRDLHSFYCFATRQSSKLPADTGQFSDSEHAKQ